MIGRLFPVITMTYFAGNFLYTGEFISLITSKVVAMLTIHFSDFCSALIDRVNYLFRVGYLQIRIQMLFRCMLPLLKFN